MNLSLALAHNLDITRVTRFKHRKNEKQKEQSEGKKPFLKSKN